MEYWPILQGVLFALGLLCLGYEIMLWRWKRRQGYAPPLFLRLRIALARMRGKQRARFIKPDYLVTACFGNREQADRLMMYEINRHPGISKAEARQRALERLIRDRSGYR